MLTLIVASRRLFVDPGSRSTATALDTTLRAAGHRTSYLELPAPIDGRIKSTVALRDIVLDSEEGVWPDQVIALDPIAALIRHPRRVLWATANPPGVAQPLRQATALRLLDRRVGRELAGCFAPSEPLATALEQNLGRSVEVLAIPRDTPPKGEWPRLAEHLLDACRMPEGTP